MILQKPTGFRHNLIIRWLFCHYFGTVVTCSNENCPSKQRLASFSFGFCGSYEEAVHCYTFFLGDLPCDCSSFNLS
ncbi:hypothetical protein YC2023_068085 [Brassica napus]